MRLGTTTRPSSTLCLLSAGRYAKSLTGRSVRFCSENSSGFPSTWCQSVLRAPTRSTHRNAPLAWENAGFRWSVGGIVRVGGGVLSAPRSYHLSYTPVMSFSWFPAGIIRLCRQSGTASGIVIVHGFSSSEPVIRSCRNPYVVTTGHSGRCQRPGHRRAGTPDATKRVGATPGAPQRRTGHPHRASLRESRRSPTCAASRTRLRGSQPAGQSALHRSDGSITLRHPPPRR